MIELDGYIIEKKVYNSRRTVVYCGKRARDLAPVVFKTFTSEYPNTEDIELLKKEYSVLTKIDNDKVIKTFGLEYYKHKPVLILEDFGGESLHSLYHNKKFGLKDFLKVGIAITELLEVIHKENIVHKDINPSNIIYNPERGIIKIIDFGIASKLPKENPVIMSPDRLEGTLPYISPEQTGRMNRFIDYRTDFYSLGATFYTLLTGQHLFISDDPLELIHCHIAKKPVPVHEVNPSVPKAVSGIIMKLLAKAAEDRYQSSYGIGYDLKLCLEQMENKSTDEIVLGTEDNSGKFQIPEKVYGRDQEVSALVGSTEKMMNGSKQVFFLGGAPGIGKTAVVHEIHKTLIKSRGYFNFGKFEQYRKDIPYSGLIQAIRDLTKQILMESNKELTLWKTHILQAVGEIGNVLIEVIPELELIIGKQPELDDLPPEESQNRFMLVFKNFIKAISTGEHPCILFLDDLQWADNATFKLLTSLLMDEDLHSFLLIGAFRDNEVDSAHALTGMIEVLEKESIEYDRLILKPLNEEYVNQMIADTLYVNPSKTEGLTRLVSEKTGCNPFFIKMFLTKLYDDSLLEFGQDSGQRTWVWDIEKIKAANITDNVVDLMKSRLEKLDDTSLECLKLACSMGAKFLIDDFICCYKKSEDATFEDLRVLFTEGLIIKTGSYIKFLHDRIQEAAYLSIDDNQRKELHYKIGKALLAKEGDVIPDDKLFSLADQLNRAFELLLENEKEQLFGINIKAGTLAKRSAAYVPALNFFKKAEELLPEESWKVQYERTFALYLDIAETEFLARNLEKAEELFELILSYAADILEETKVYAIKIRHYIPQGKTQEAVEMTYSVLNTLGVKLPPEITMPVIQEEMGEVIKLLDGRSAEQILDLPVMEDPKKIAATALLILCVPAAINVNPPLASVMILRIVNLSLQFGIAPATGMAIAAYSTFLSSMIGDIKTGIEFGEVGIQMAGRSDSKLTKSIIYFNNYFTNLHYKIGMRDNLVKMESVIPICKEAGNFEYLGYVHSFMFSTYIFAGVNLDDIISAEVTKYATEVHNLQQQQTTTYFDTSAWCVYTLSGKTDRIVGLKNPILVNDETMIARFTELNSFTGLTTFYILRIMTKLIMREYEKLPEYLAVSEQLIDSTYGLPQNVIFYFYLGVSLYTLYEGAGEQDQKDYREKLTGIIEKYKNWGDANPANYLNKYYFLMALQADIAGESFETVIGHFNKALSLARDNQIMHEQALAAEYAAFYCLQKEYHMFARSYMTEAYYTYSQWGSVPKRQQMEEKYTHLLYKISEGANSGLAGTLTSADETISSTDSRVSSTFDLASIVKASNTLSRAIRLDDLLATMMKIVIENAGAQKGYFLLYHDSAWHVEAEGFVDKEEVEVLQSIPLSSSTTGGTMLVPLSIIHYVERTKESVVLSDACREGDFTTETYIMEKGSKSLLCMPLLNQGKLSGILYLENDLTTGAFTEHRLNVLSTLSSQIAISIENARMYKDLDDLNKNLEIKVQQRTKQLSDANKEIVSSITYAKKIQLAILPKEEEFKNTFTDYFIFYKPLNIVGGDFYWFEKTENGFLIAVIDCTGHGVPGAFMTMMGRSILNHVASHICGDNPGEILKEVNRLVKQMLSQYTRESKTDDGMDAGICYVKTGEKKLIFAGARIPLYYCKNNECIDIRGDKMSLGYTRSELDYQFTNHEVDLEGDEVFYMTSDGIIDQSGGPKGIGFGRKRMRELLARHSSKALSEQQLNIEEELAEYQGDKLQRDDITVIGFKL